ncbi:FxSxx-COOH system tetratricopeptide repeat protein [Actinokineospora terrae]|uniref:NB-ARC domain-containing protein n=1 Tax=Actinokineospora terrae TaxID=155974 RepID=A0A1H9MD47_9PSEU|nr:FxSxx-COOH system tetratricopeptide repeat protein [Actinokineospora terrae]SER21377.1 NB-ARC domain-containing protein [Actinokineospora terrae]
MKPSNEDSPISPDIEEHPRLVNFASHASGITVQARNIDNLSFGGRSTSVDWSAAKGVHNLPVRNPEFTGQHKWFAELEARLPVAAIRGLGGVGKSQLALEYAHRGREKYAVRWWLRAEDDQTLMSDLMSLAFALGLDTSLEQQQVLASLSAELSRHHDWLLVLDNATGPEALARIPSSERGHVLVTTRYRNWAGVARPIDVTEMSTEDAVAFFATTPDNATVELVHLLGRLPLALAQARSYTEVHSCSVTRYLELYRNAAQELLRLGPRPAGYPDTVATTWLLHFQVLSPVAKALLDFIAFLAPDSIPLDLLFSASDHLPRTLREVAADPLNRENALGELIATSLLSRTRDDVVRVHRLVQQVTRDRLTPKEQATWRSSAVSALAGLVPHGPGHPESWPEMERLDPHIRTVASDVKPTQRIAPHVGQLLFAIGLSLSRRGERTTAIQIFTQALPMFQRAGSGPERLMQAQLWNHIGSAQMADNPADGIASFTLAIELIQRTLGAEHPELIKSLVMPSSRLISLGLHDEALSRLRLAMKIWSRSGEKKDIDLLEIQSCLAFVMHEKEDYETAFEFHRHAISLSAAVHGSEHSATITYTVRYASTALAAGHIDLARSLLAKALPILRSTLGVDHEHTLDAEELAARAELGRS